MSIEDLLIQRFEVIADYPNSIMKIGLIIKSDKGLIYCDPEGDKYQDFPHLFKKLNWWEKRAEYEMPKYLKHTFSDGKTTYHQVKKWDFSNPEFIEWRCDDDFGCFGMWSKDFNYMPCTEVEYLANKA